jgi:hypothetical protein
LQSAGTTAITVDTSQNVGIGTTSPSTYGKFVTYSSGGYSAITTDGQIKSYQLLDVATAGGRLTGGSSQGVLGDIGIEQSTTGAKGGYLRFGTCASGSNSPTDRMIIDSSGNVGIGVTPPANPKVTIRQAVNGTDGGLLITSADGSGSAGLARLNDGGMTFRNAGAEAMRIDSGGSLLVGKTTTSDTTVGAIMQSTGKITGTQAASTNASDTLTIYSTGAGNYRFYVGMGGTVYATSTTITAISDQRLKENIRDLDEGLATVMALKPRKFDWKEGKGANIKNARGFIAQEFETVLPDMIDEWKDPAPEGEEPYKAINANLIPTLVKAIQELKAEFDAYKATHP